jgi:hypothetical protein
MNSAGLMGAKPIWMLTRKPVEGWEPWWLV